MRDLSRRDANVPIKFKFYLENSANARWIYVFWVVNPLFPTTMGHGRIVNLPMTCPVKFQLCSSITLRMCVEFTCFVINPSFLTPPGTVESSTYAQPVPKCRWRACEVSTLYLENCVNARRSYVFWVISPLFLTLRGYGRNVNLSTTYPVESWMYLWSFFVSWKLCKYTSNLCFLSN